MEARARNDGIVGGPSRLFLQSRRPIYFQGRGSRSCRSYAVGMDLLRNKQQQRRSGLRSDLEHRSGSLDSTDKQRLQLQFDSRQHFGGGGSGAAATAQFQTSNYLAGLLQHVTVTNPGSGYNSNPSVSFQGSNCTVLPTAVADIYSPVFDVSGTVWNESNGASSGMGPIYTSASYLTINHLEVRGMEVDHTIAPGSGTLYMWTHVGTGSIFQTVYMHHVSPDVITTTGTPSFNGTGILSINQGYANTTTVTDSFFDNTKVKSLFHAGLRTALQQILRRHVDQAQDWWGNDSHRKCYSRHPWPALLSCSNWTRLSRQSDLGYNS